jgi:cytochrome c biogenesis protein CcmG/thiol:disulfide interchange protein DsbE
MVRDWAQALGCAVVLAGCATTGGNSSGRTGSSLTDFALPDVGGQEIRLSDLVAKQQIVYLDFWATWCGPCVAEMPQLERLYETYKGQGFVVLGISMDDPTTMGTVASYVHRNGLTFPVMIDMDSRVTGIYNSTRSAPYGVLIDRGGKIVEEHPGYTPGDETALEMKIKEHL